MSIDTRARDAARTSGRVMANQNVALLVLRGVVGVLFVGHGTGKLFGWFGQGGLDGTGAFFESVGYQPGRPLAVVAGLAETVGGLSLVLGLLTPLGAAAVIGMMVNAAGVKSAAGYWIANNGFEYESVVIVVMLVLAIAGPGAYSLDHGRPWSFPAGVRVGVAAVLGFGAGLVMVAMRG